MKLITAVVKPHKVGDVKDALKAEGITGMTVAEAQGFGRQGGHTDVYRGTEYVVEFIPKTEIQVIVDDDVADKIVATIVAAAKTDTIGDGKIWVTSVERLVRIRTGEEGPEAI